VKNHRLCDSLIFSALSLARTWEFLSRTLAFENKDLKKFQSHLAKKSRRETLQRFGRNKATFRGETLQRFARDFFVKSARKFFKSARKFFKSYFITLKCARETFPGDFRTKKLRNKKKAAQPVGGLVALPFLVGVLCRGGVSF
jgi:hypothetical protein